MSSSPPSSHPGLPQLSAFALGKLPAADREFVRAHLGQCAECRQALASLKAGPSRTLPSLAPSSGKTAAPLPVAASQTSAGRAVAGGRSATTPPPEFANHPRYEIVKLLGEGGMGAVFLANDKQLGRKVALKIPRIGTGNETILARFEREARAAATLEHPNICPVYDVGTHQGVPYLTMAYIEGRPLAEWLTPGKQAPENQAASLVRKLALILDEAHRRGIIHRDLKPSNVMINPRKELVIMDFGLARRVGADEARLTQDGSMLGTPSYMPPEQATGDIDQMGPACDIYALGVILYELLAGRLPFVGTPIQVLYQVMMETPAPPSAHRPGVNRGLEAVCLKAMAKKPADRFASMAEFAAALDRYSQFRDPRPIWKRLSRRTWAAVAGAAVLLALVVGLVATRGKPVPNRPETVVVETAPTNSIGMKLAPIPAGKFLMGAAPGEAGAQGHESPRHRVEISRPFQMGVHEVTQAQFEQVMGYNPSYFCKAGDGADKVAGMDTTSFPVESVSWGEAVAFCRKLSERPAEKKAGRAYRLPTEAEWEYACRVGAETAFHTGSTLTAKQANINGWFRYGPSERGPNLQRTTTVGSYPPNEYGLYDMHGNVWEWCHDWWDPGYYGKSPQTDPTGPDSGENRVVRGGAWENIYWPTGVDHRCAYRGADPPGARLRHVGFRVVCLPAPGSGPMPGKPEDVPLAPSSENAIDLLKLIDLKKTFVFGDWKMERGVLVSPTDQGVRLQIPYIPPEEYRIIMVIERCWHRFGMVLGIPAGNGLGGGLGLDFTGGGESVSGLHLLDGKALQGNETRWKGVALGEGLPTTIVCTVRKTGIEVTRDGKPFLDWTGDLRRLSVSGDCAMPDPNMLSLATWTSYRFHKLELIPLAGQGRHVRDYVGELRRREHGVATHGLALSPDGRTALFGFNHPHLWLYGPDLRPIRLIHGQRAGSGLCPTFVNNGKWCLTGSYDGVIRLWDVATGDDLWHYSGFPGHAETIVALPDGKRFLTGHTDGGVRLWGLPTEQMVSNPKDPQGLKAEFFQGTDLKDKVAERIDRQIDRFYEGPGAVPIDRVSNDNYSIRWTGWLKAPAPGKYRLVTHVDDGIRLWLDDKLLIDHWHVGSHSRQADVELTRTPHALKIEYFQGGYPAWLSLRWSQIGRFAEQPIPAAALFHDEDAARRTTVVLPKEHKRLDGHTGHVHCVAVAPNGRDAISASQDGTVRLWDLQTGKEMRRFVGHAGVSFCVAFSPDGQRALSGGQDRIVREWDVATAKELRRFLGHHAEVRWLVYSPDGRRFASASYDATVRLWDLEATVEARKELHCFRGHRAAAHAVAFTPDSKRLISTSNDGSLRVWQIPSDEALRSQWPKPKREPPGPAVDLLKLMDGKDRFIRGDWKLAEGALLAPAVGNGPIEIPYSPPDEYRLQITLQRTRAPDTAWLLFPIGGKRAAFVIDAYNGKSSGLFFIDGHEGHTDEAIYRGLVLKDGQPTTLVMNVTRDRVQVTANGASIIDWRGDPRRLWLNSGYGGLPDRPTFALMTATCPCRISRFVLTPLSGTGQPAQVEGEVRRMHEYTLSVAVSPDGKRILSAGNPSLRFWDPANSTLLRSSEGHRGQIHRALYSPDGRRILTGSADATVRLWDAETGRMIQEYPGHPGDWTCVAIASNNRTAASGGQDAKLRLWELPPPDELPAGAAAKAEGAARLLTGHSNSVWSVAFSPDGTQLISTSEDGTARLWDVATAKEVRRFEGHGGPIYCATFTTDGKRLVTGGRDHYLRVWDSETGKELARLAGHRALVFCLARSADGQRLLSGSDDAAVILWDLESGRELHRFTGHTHWVRSVAFHPDGQHVVSGSPDSTTRVWRLPEKLSQERQPR